MSHLDPSMDRRSVLVAGAGVAAAAAVPGAATAQSDDLESWLADASEYDGVEDHTGQDAVTVDVGAAGGLAFGPPAIRVEPGATVTWEWTGNGGPHNVAEVDGAFRSGETTPEVGTTFEYTFESAGEFRYVCEPHEAAGMKGAVVVEQTGPPPEVEAFLANTSNYDGLVDHTGEDAVTVEVGVGDNGLLFGPPAIRVDPGTTVVWEWTGQGGTHNVAEVDGAFRSGDAVADSSTTFEHTFEEGGVAKYVCESHESIDMKGAVVVGGAGSAGGSGGVGGDGSIASSTFAAVAGVLLVPILFALALVGKELASDDDGDQRVGHSHP